MNKTQRYSLVILFIFIFVSLLSCETQKVELKNNDVCKNLIEIALIDDSLGGQYIVARNKNIPFSTDLLQGLNNGNVYGIISDCEGSSIIFYTDTLQGKCREIKFIANKKLYLDSFYMINPITLESQFSHTEYVYRPEFINDSGWVKCNIDKKIKDYKKMIR